MKRLLPYIAFALLASSCENDMNAVRRFDATKMGVEQADTVETIISQTAHVKGVLTAPYMERNLNTPPFTEFPRGLKVVFYSDSLTETSELTAKYGKMMQNENDIFLRDSVVFKNYKTLERLDCKELKWDAKRQLFVSNSFSRVATPTDTLYGQGFEANQNFSLWRFINAYGSFLPPDSTLSFE